MPYCQPPTGLRDLFGDVSFGNQVDGLVYVGISAVLLATAAAGYVRSKGNDLVGVAPNRIERFPFRDMVLLVFAIVTLNIFLVDWRGRLDGLTLGEILSLSALQLVLAALWMTRVLRKRGTCLLHDSSAVPQPANRERTGPDRSGGYGVTYGYYIAVADRPIRLLGFVLFVVYVWALLFAGVGFFRYDHCAGEYCYTNLWRDGLSSFTSALYLSVVTITTLGYGDMQPWGASRLLAMVEAALGYFTMGLLISILVLKLQSNKSIRREIKRRGKKRRA